jgi:hypothetical protein
VITRWIGAGANSLWTNPTNWDALSVPGFNSDVIITNSGAAHIVLDVDTTIASLNIGGAPTTAVLELRGVTLHADGVNVIGTNGTIEVLSNSTFTSSSSLQNFGAIKVPADLGIVTLTLDCNFTNYSTIDVETNSTLNLPGSNLLPFWLLDGTTFAGPGTIQFPATAGDLICYGLMTVDGTVEFQRQALIFGQSTWTGPGLFRLQSGGMTSVNFAPDFHVELSGWESLWGICTNQGFVRVPEETHLDVSFATLYNTGTFQIETNCHIEGVAGFENSGTIKVPAGLGAVLLDLSCNFTNYGTIDVGTNSILELPGGNWTDPLFSDGTFFTGPGTVRFLPTDGIVVCEGVITANGTIEFQRETGGIFGHATWTGPGVFRWQNGIMGGLTFAPDFHVEISGPHAIFVDCTNQGSMRLVGNTDLGITMATLYNSGLFQIETNGSINSSFGLGNFHNTGTIKVPAGLGTVSFALNCNLTNYGTIEVGTNSELNLSSTNVVDYLFEGTTFTGPGTVRFFGDANFMCSGLLTMNGTTEFQRPTAVIFGQSTWTGSGLFRWQGGAMGNITFAPDFHVELSGQNAILADCTNQGSIRLLGNNNLGVYGAKFYNTGLFQIESNCYIKAESSSGNFENAGTIKVPAGLGAQTLAFNCTFTNYGTLDVETNSELNLFITNSPSAALFADGSVFDGAGILRLLGDGYFTCLGTMKVTNTVEYKSQSLMFGPSQWTGPGLFRWRNGLMVAFTFAPDFHVEMSGPDWKSLSLYCTNQGTIRWLGNSFFAGSYEGPEILFNEGLIQVETNGFWWDFQLTNEPSGTFRQLTGELSIDTFCNYGTIQLDTGKLDVQRNFSSTNTSVYQVLLSGTVQFTNFNQLNVTNLALDGSLQVVLTNGFSPADGDTFAIIHSGSQTGRFSSVTVPALQSNLTWHVQYLPNSVVLVVSQPPATTGTTYTNGQFQFSFSGPAGGAYDIQVSTNLIDWTTVETNNVFPGNVMFTDTNAANFDKRYYRCRLFQ